MADCGTQRMSRRRLVRGALLGALALSLATAGCAQGRPPDPAQTPVEIPRRQAARLGDAIHLLGFDLGPTMIQPSGVLELTLYWRADGPVPSDYVVFVEVTGPTGQVHAYKERLAGDDHLSPTQWRVGETVVDSYALALRGDGPPGFYQVWVGMLDPSDGMRRLPAYGNGQRLANDAIRLNMVIEAEP